MNKIQAFMHYKNMEWKAFRKMVGSKTKIERTFWRNAWLLMIWQSVQVWR